MRICKLYIFIISDIRSVRTIYRDDGGGAAAWAGPDLSINKTQTQNIPRTRDKSDQASGENFDTLCLSCNFPLSNIYVSDGFWKNLALIQGNKESSDIFYFFATSLWISHNNITTREGFWSVWWELTHVADPAPAPSPPWPAVRLPRPPPRPPRRGAACPG